MEEEIEPSAEYIKAFNNGYLLNQHNPKLLDQMLQSSDRNNAYIKAMTDGKRQHEKEKIKQQMDRQKEQKPTQGPKR